MKRLFSIFSLIILFSSASLYSQERIYAPSLFLPEDTEVGVAPNVILDWNAVTGGTLDITYELQLADNADFNDSDWENAQPATEPGGKLCAQIMPAIKFIDDGGIMPGNENWLLHFEAVNLNKVDIIIRKIIIPK